MDNNIELVVLLPDRLRFAQLLCMIWRRCDMYLLSVGMQDVPQPPAMVHAVVMVMSWAWDRDSRFRICCLRRGGHGGRREAEHVAAGKADLD